MSGSNPIDVPQEYYDLAYRVLLGLQASRAETALGRPFVVKRVMQHEDRAVVVNSKNTEIIFKISSFARGIEHVLGYGREIVGIRGKAENSVENIVGTEANFALPYIWGLLVRVPGVERDTRNVIRKARKSIPKQETEENALEMDYRALMAQRKEKSKP